MAKEEVKNLFEVFDSIVDLMEEDKFDSHEFIKMLAKHRQVEYVRALNAMEMEGNDPFRKLHAQIAKELKKHCTDLKVKVKSNDIFGNEGECELWEKNFN